MQNQSCSRVFGGTCESHTSTPDTSKQAREPLEQSEEMIRRLSGILSGILNTPSPPIPSLSCPSTAVGAPIPWLPDLLCAGGRHAHGQWTNCTLASPLLHRSAASMSSGPTSAQRLGSGIGFVAALPIAPAKPKPRFTLLGRTAGGLKGLLRSVPCTPARRPQSASTWGCKPPRQPVKAVQPLHLIWGSNDGLGICCADCSRPQFCSTLQRLLS